MFETYKTLDEMTEAVRKQTAADELYPVHLRGITVERNGEGKFIMKAPGSHERRELFDLPETLNTFFERSGQTMAANKRLSVESRLEVMNTYCFPTVPAKKTGLVLVRGGKVLALHSSRYAYIPQGALLDTLKTVLSKKGEISFEEGSYSPVLTRLKLGFKNDEILEDYKNSCLKAGLSPLLVKGSSVSFIFHTNDVGTCKAKVVPCLNLAGKTLWLDDPFAVEHKDGGLYFSLEKFKKGAEAELTTARTEAAAFGKLCFINILNPEKCVEKCIRKAKLKEKSAKGTEELLLNMDYKRLSNAFQVYIALHDFLDTEALKASSREYREKCRRNLRKLVHADWTKLDR